MTERLMAYRAHPSSETEAAMYGQIKIDDLREYRQKEIIFFWMLAADGIGILLCLRYNLKTATV